MTKKILDTERLRLREFSLTDADFVVELLNEPGFLRYIGDKGVRNADDAMDYLRTGPIASYRDNGFGLYHVSTKADGRSIGMCGILKRPDQQHPDIGYAFLASESANGYAFEAGMATLEYGHRRLGLKTIDAFVDPQNARSIRLLGKLGLRHIGSMRMSKESAESSHYRAEAGP